MGIPILLDGQGPLYLQLKRGLLTLIEAGRTSDRLPSTRDVSLQLGLSRNTVRAAFAALGAEGIVTSRLGSGHFVVSPPALPSAPRQARSIAAQSAFARRSREGTAVAVRLHRPRSDLRFNLQYGEPLADVRLAEIWRRELGRVAARVSLGYPDAQGLPELRTAICAYLRRRRGVTAHPDDVLVVSGAQQALSLAARVLLDDGDSVALETPGYFLARECFQAHGARVVALDVDAFGMTTHRLPRRRVKLVCVTPSHQFPLGVVMADSRRAELLAYARRHDTWILEDDYDGEFRFDGRDVPTLRSMDGDDRVIHVGSFSKVLAPSLRLAYVIMPRALRRDFITAKRLADLGCPAVDQAALAGFINAPGLDRHVQRVVTNLKERRDALLAGLARHTTRQLEVFDSSAGMHVVARLRHGSPSREEALVARAAGASLGIYPLSGHYARSPQYGLLLGYAGVSPRQIGAACRVLGTCLAGL